MTEAEWTRSEFVRRAAGAGVAVAGALTPRWVEGALAAVDAGTPPVHRFHSRPDLAPPVLNVLRKRSGTTEGHLFLSPNSGPGRRGPLLLDDRGDVLWFHDSHPVVAMNFRAAVYRGKPVLTWWAGRTTRGLGDGTHVIMDSSYRVIAHVPAGNGRPSDLHEFVLTNRGTALVTAWERRDADLTAVGGPSSAPVVGGVLQELEMPSGRVLFEWRSLDHVAIAESHQEWTPKGAHDYFHINSVELDRDGNYIVSARNTWAVYKIHAGSGEVMWRLGGKRSDFAMGPGTGFAWQHDARRHGGSEYLISLFDDGAAPAVEQQSKGLILALDFKRMRATAHRAYHHHPAVLAHALGSVQVFPNGNVLVGWGTAPYITEYSSGGEVLFDARLPKGGENYRALRMPWVGRPAAPPDFVEKFLRGHHIVYASWNGATELAAWRVEAQPGGSVSTHRRTGFETEIVAPGPAKHLLVTPVDRKGKALHRATTVKV